MRTPNHGSLNDRISKLEIGGRLYEERTHDDYLALQRAVSASSRYPASMRYMQFTTSVFTAVPAGRLGDVRLLVCVERVA